MPWEDDDDFISLAASFRLAYQQELEVGGSALSEAVSHVQPCGMKTGSEASAQGRRAARMLVVMSPCSRGYLSCRKEGQTARGRGM
jgi:hypothetical protein